MKNVVVVAEGGILTLKVDLNKHFGPSKTGNTFIVGTTSGPKPIAGYPGYSVSLTVFRKRYPDKKKKHPMQDFRDEVGEE